MTEGFKQTGELVKKVRKQKKITQVKLAELAEVSQGYIADLENGKLKNPASQKLLLIAKILEIPSKQIQDAIWDDQANQFLETISDPSVVSDNEYLDPFAAEETSQVISDSELLTRFHNLSTISQQTVKILIENLEKMEAGK